MTFKEGTMKKLQKLSLLLVCIIPSITQSMLRTPSACSNRPCPQRRASPTLALAKSCTRMVPRRSSVSMPIALHQQLQEIDKKIRVSRMKKIVTLSRSMAWNVNGALLGTSMAVLYVPTIAALGLTGVCSTVGLLTLPVAVVSGHGIEWLEECAVYYPGFLASYGALCGGEKLSDYLAKKCDDTDTQATSAKQLLEELQKQRKGLTDIHKESI